MSDRVIFHVKNATRNRLLFTIGIEYRPGDLSTSYLPSLFIAWAKPSTKNGSKKYGYFMVNRRLDRMTLDKTHGEPPSIIRKHINEYVDKAKAIFKSVDLSRAVIRL